MKFNNWSVLIYTEDAFIENQKINLTFFPCKRPHEKGRHLTRVVRFDPDAGDLYVKIDGKKYYYGEFK